ncbi:MAG: sugar kinase [Bifidobacteriaceae bacterium]|jgi:2-dehydro-3-deoxygluconokinase|nr:sugar kinase [Bifidobacteriaceae bacterium]
MVPLLAPMLQAKPADQCAYDIVALGEIMLRLDPGDRRIRTTRRFDVWDSGAEYNVARAFRKVFGLRGAMLTAFARNEVGLLLEDIILASGLDLSYVHWVPYDGVGRNVRNGLNFSERGFGVRGALGCVDRAYTAISQLRPQDIDLAEIFVTKGSRWFHTGGIMAGLSDQAAETTLAVMKAARDAGTIVSYDLNYRPSLWAGAGGIERCREVNRELAKYVDVMIGNEEDFTVCLGQAVDGFDDNLTALDVAAYRRMIQTAAEVYPNFQVIATTLRQARTATRNDWSAIAWSRSRGFAEAKSRPDLEIYDRLGSGDSFASGLAYGLLIHDDLQLAVEYGAANGALAQTSPGDTTTASLAEIERLADGNSARVQR